ncbi:unnamed protein product [Sympodiomycopsis kandeliae]
MTRIKLASSSETPKLGEKKDFVAFGQGDDALKILLSNVKGQIHATSAKCTHYGAPLANGVLTEDGRLICPWHGACFHAKTGDIEDAPALDSLLSFPVEIDSNGDIYVDAEEEQLKGKPGRPITCSGQVNEVGEKTGKGFVIVGGGSAAINAIESARKSGYSGSITLLTADPYEPIDRTKISKGLVGDANALIWRSAAHLKNVLKVDVKQGAVVKSVSAKDSNVKLESGETIPYNSLLLATGGTPKRLPVPGAKEGELKGVHVIRDVQHVSTLLKSLGDKGDKDVVVIGSSFIGVESAIALAGQKKAKSVTVVGMESVPLENVLGAEVGKGIQAAQEKNNGIKFYMKASVSNLEGDGNSKVKLVKIKDSNGQEVSLKADAVLLGVGVGPATGFLKDSTDSGFPALEKDGSVTVDSALRVTNLSAEVKNKNIFAAGDIATFPSFNGQSKIRIEHWNVAGNQGRAIGETVTLLEQNAARKDEGVVFNKLPIFWSALGGQLRYVSDGNPDQSTEFYLDGNVAEGKFVAYYAYKNGKVKALASMGKDPIMAHFSELMRLKKDPSLQEIKDGLDPLKISLLSDSK